MARLQANDSSSVIQIRAFLGINENPDGDTHIRDGELSVCRNFSITHDHHLKLRPGQKTIISLKDAWEQEHVNQASTNPSNPSVENACFCGAWTGTIQGTAHLLAAYGGKIFDVKPDGSLPKAVGTCTQDRTSFFGFGNRVYCLNGHEYLSWDGEAASIFEPVSGYIPTIQTATSPQGDGTPLENVNRLTGKRRVEFSPDGKATVFQLPEKQINAIIAVEGCSSAYTLNAADGTITFSTVPDKGINSLVIIYQKGQGARAEVEAMHDAEFYNGATDARVFLYGDGSNRTIYSGVCYDTGMPSAEYFPDLYEASIGDENIPITAMIRHYSRLLIYKTDSAWAMDYNTLTTALGAVTAAFYIVPVNRQIGNEAVGQVHLLENDPLTLCNHTLYRWKATSSSGITADNRNALRISDRVRATLSSFHLSDVITFNRLCECEYWILDHPSQTALIYNYAADAWYYYTNMPFWAMLEFDGELYGITKKGEIRHISQQYRNDNGQEIDAYAATGSMDFGRDWQRKYSPQIFAAIRPESGARVYITVETNRRSDYPNKLVSAGLAGFNHVDFKHFSFGTNRKPKVKRIKMKVKKATFYKLIYKSKSASATVTMIETDIKLRFAGDVK